MWQGLCAAATCASLLLTASTAIAQQSVLMGNVLLDEKETPLANAEIQIAKLNVSARSDSAGKFRISSIPVGRHQVLVRLLGYEPFTVHLDFRTAEPVDVDFVLKPTVTRLSEVEVRDNKTTGPWAIKLAEFDERRRVGVGKFLTADFFEAQDGRPVSSYLASKIAGLRIVDKNGRRMLSSGGRSGGECLMQVIVNGVTRYNGTPNQPPFDVDELQSKEIIGFEFYTTATTPLQYNSTRGSNSGSCGTVIIWTKGG